MAYTTINKSTDYFQTELWSAQDTSIDTINFAPDWVWIKSRTNADSQVLFDRVRGANKRLSSSGTTAEQTTTGELTAFNSDGYTLGTGDNVNRAGNNYVSWNWKANGAGSANTDGSISSTVSVNTTSGFSIVKWTGNGGTASVGHGLGVKPNIVIKKNLAASTNWIFSTTIIDGSNDFFYLNSTNAKGDSGETAPTASLINLYANSENNGNGNNMIAYCFAEKTGYSKFGSFVGNGNDDGTFVYTGFKPSFILLKNTSATSSWVINDNKRPGYNANSQTLVPNNNEAENTGTDRTDFLSNGFKLRVGASTAWNGNGNTIIYMAFASAPLVGSNNVPCTAR